MMISGWITKYNEIVKEFNYSKKLDEKSAFLLENLLKENNQFDKLERMIENQTVFVVGAGPSLLKSISFLKSFEKTIKIVADSAVKTIFENGIKPDIIVTDLDGDPRVLKKIGKTNTIFVVHAHGDNIDKLEFVKNFKNFLGTTQTKPFGKLFNFGGFTDGDRAVFLAEYFRPKKIILCGMDFGTRIGKFSYTKPEERKVKLKKLRKGKHLLEWLASKSRAELFTTSDPIPGFKKIKYKDLDIIIT